jgi:hypothetical protein
MEKMGEGITAVATAMTQAPEAAKETIENVGSTLQGRAQLKVRTEECLTGEGQLLMLDQFTDPALARTYLSTSYVSSFRRDRWKDIALVILWTLFTIVSEGTGGKKALIILFMCCF